MHKPRESIDKQQEAMKELKDITNREVYRAVAEIEDYIGNELLSVLDSDAYHYILNRTDLVKEYLHEINKIK